MRLLIAALCLGATTAAADEVIAAYYTTLGPADFYTPQGARLRDLGAVVRQDRANHYLFDRPDAGDESDPFFEDDTMRAQIPDLVASGPGSPVIANIVRSGGSVGVLVCVCGTRGAPSFITVDFADGDGYRGC